MIFIQKVLKALVVGYGSIGKRHIDNLSTFSNMEILVCSNRKYDKFLKEKHCKLFDSLDDCIKEKPTFAIITNETHLHVKTALKLAKAGINLFIEKPLSNSLNGIKELLNITNKKKLVTLIGCNFRFHPSIKIIKEIINSGELGRIISVRVENGSFLPNWHPFENYQQTYAAKENLGGGVILTNIHEIDYLYWFFGNIHEVYSITGNFSDLDIKADDLSTVLLRFKNNIIAEAHLDYFQQPATRNCKIIGTKGTVIWDMSDNIVKYYNIQKKVWTEKLKSSNYDFNLMYLDELHHFIDCIIKKKKTINCIKEGIYTLKVALAIKRSSKLKKAQIVDR